MCISRLFSLKKMPPYKRRRIKRSALNNWKLPDVPIRYHGNYVGPGWSGGKYQDSVAWSNIPPIDKFDETAKRHDKVYRLQRGNPKYLNLADDKFYSENIYKGTKRTAAALAVKVQRLARGNPPSNNQLSVVKRGKTSQFPPTPTKQNPNSSSIPQNNSMPILDYGKRRTAIRVSRSRKKTYKRKRAPVRRTRKRTAKSSRRKFVTKNKRSRNVTKVSRFSTHGSIFKYENGSTITDSHAVYVGVSDMPFDQVYKGACRCIVRDLFRQSGILIENWKDLIPVFNGEYQFYYRYISGETETLTSPSGMDLLSTWSFEQFATEIADLWKAAFGTASDHRIKDCYLQKTSNVSAGGVQRAATLHFSNYYITVNTYASIHIQNTTTGNATTDVEDTDVTRNPLVARVYHIKGNALIPRAYVSPTSGQKIVADTQTGFLGFTQTQQGAAIYQKLPPASQFLKCYKSNSFKIAPGAIKKFSVSYKKSMLFNKLFVLNARGMADDTEDYQLPFGTSVLVGFEKLLDSRVAGSPIRLGYQWDFVIKVASRYNDRSYTTPILNVN